MFLCYIVTNPVLQGTPSIEEFPMFLYLGSVVAVGDIMYGFEISVGVIVGVAIMAIILFARNERMENLNFYAMVVINTARELIQNHKADIEKIDVNLFTELKTALENMESALTDESITLKEGLEYIMSFSTLVDRVMKVLEDSKK